MTTYAPPDGNAFPIPQGDDQVYPPVPYRPEPPVALEPDDFPHPVRAQDVEALVPKIIG